MKASPRPELRWLRDGSGVDETERVTAEFDGETCVLRVRNVELDDEGEYECVARNELGMAKSRAELLVNEAEGEPQFIQKIQDVTVQEGGEARFDARVRACPDAEVDWFRGGAVVKDEGRFSVVDDEEAELFSLVIEDVKPEDSDSYECVAFNSVGEVSCKATLQVTENLIAPEFLGDAQTSPLIFDEGDDVEVGVEVRGTPEPAVTWLKDDQPLKETSRVAMEIKPVPKETSRVAMEPGPGVLTLLIKGATPDDTGKYRCELKSKAGAVSRSFDIRVQGTVILFNSCSL